MQWLWPKRGAWSAGNASPLFAARCSRHCSRAISPLAPTSSLRGSRLQAHTTVIMPQTTPAWVVDRARADGAEVILTKNIADAFAEAQRRAHDGQVLIHPFDDEHVMAGQGTIGLELLEDIPQLATLVMSIGGGGLISCVSMALKGRNPYVRIFGVESSGAPAMQRSVAAGRASRSCISRSGSSRRRGESRTPSSGWTS